jgi:hypothetical protein
MWVGGQHHAPAALPAGKTRYPLYRRLGRPQGRSGRVRKISPPRGFVQPVASRYTDCAIPAPDFVTISLYILRCHVCSKTEYTRCLRCCPRYRIRPHLPKPGCYTSHGCSIYRFIRLLLTPQCSSWRDATKVANDHFEI